LNTAIDWLSFPLSQFFFYVNTPVIVNAATEITNMLSDLREFFEQTTNPQAEERKKAVCPAVIVFCSSSQEHDNSQRYNGGNIGFPPFHNIVVNIS